MPRVFARQALPTDAEIEQAGAADAGIYMERLRAEDEERYQRMLRERATAWGAELSASNVSGGGGGDASGGRGGDGDGGGGDDGGSGGGGGGLKLDRRIDHLLAIIMRTILGRVQKSASAGSKQDELALSQKEARLWVSKVMRSAA